MRRLCGGEGRIRTPGTASASMGGIRPELGPLLEPKKSIRAGENLFAWNSALFGLSPVRFIRQADARNWIIPNIRRRLVVQIFPLGPAVSNSNLPARNCTRRRLRGRRPVARRGLAGDGRTR